MNMQDLYKIEARIEEIISRRIHDAKELKLISRAREIVKRYGEGANQQGWKKKTFKDGELEIILENREMRVQVKNGEKIVFDAMLDNIVIFNPGPWVKKIVDLGARIEEEERERQIAKRKRDLYSECENWGIDPKEIGLE